MPALNSQLTNKTNKTAIFRIKLSAIFARSYITSVRRAAALVMPV